MKSVCPLPQGGGSPLFLIKRVNQKPPIQISISGVFPSIARRRATWNSKSPNPSAWGNDNYYPKVSKQGIEFNPKEKQKEKLQISISKLNFHLL